MTRGEKLATTKANMLEAKDRPKPDSAILNFLSKRKEEALQVRYWARIGHELPKKRKVLHKEMTCT